MAGFKFERDLPHQVDAVKSILKVFDDVHIHNNVEKSMQNVSNPIVNHVASAQYSQNLLKIQEQNKINTDYKNSKSNILDISMETGTGKTYTYTKMMFELNKNLNISKFIVIVPTLSIKAGTINFLKAKATKEHFRQEYKTEIKTYVVESKKGKKNKKDYMPQAVSSFVEANNFGAKTIHVMIINSGMINSDTMSKEFDVNLFDRYNNPFDAIASIKPFTIVDEPHKFPLEDAKGKTATTWGKIEKFKSQFIVRYGATFASKFKNLVYKLSAVDAFNDDLVKGVTTYVEEFENGKEVSVTLKSTDGIEASFELNMNGIKTTHKLIKKASMSKIHDEMHDLYIENLNKSVVVLSNGLELKRNNTINPYSYSQSLQDKMMEKTIKKHFELEKLYLTQEVRIKPLTLFFIDDIEGYRDGHNISGSLKTKFESLAKVHIENLLKEETDKFYREYLEKSLKDLSLIHGGYFSKDNSDKDEKVEKEITEILHDKESLLSLDNVRRFIFSKWTLREGWDNPNVFQICKLRSSGSTTSKLQEVGRGLRLPVNEYMGRVKDGNFKLHYYVDFTEKEFVTELVTEINNNSGTFNIVVPPTKLTDDIINTILANYPEFEDSEELLDKLDELGTIKRNNDFKENGFDTVLKLFPEAFSDGLDKDKVTDGNKPKEKVTFRKGKYSQLKELWEAINKKVILEYDIEDENKFGDLLKGYFLDNLNRFKPQGVKTHERQLEFDHDIAFYKEYESLDEEILPIVTMSYKSFLIEICGVLNVNINTLHNVFMDIQKDLDINSYRNVQTIRTIKSGFNQYLLSKSITDFKIGYNEVNAKIHPTKFTNEDGTAKDEVASSDLGVHFEYEPTADSYLFNELFYDSQLEKSNIKTNVKSVTVFTKIPKNSIKIPVAGGGTYSPDFAYVIEDEDNNKSLNLVVETKGKDEISLSTNEEKKIKHAQVLFENFGDGIEVVFKPQFDGMAIGDIIKESLKKDK
ncbi:MAG: type III restriction-modification system endonuclease [Campylobacterota bacterium]|nr:type III restriction-modification system endonuclease [Campylobacterota bacterium]